MKYFTIEELTRSEVARRKGIDNTPIRSQYGWLVLLTDKVLDPAREAYGKPVRVTSGFRCAELNKAVGGAYISQHTEGKAADLRCNDNAALFRILRKQGQFDQLIWEHGDHEQPEWVHVSYNGRANRHQVLRACTDMKGKTFYLPYQ